MTQRVVLGAVGMAVVDELAERSQPIRVVNRRADVPEGVEVRRRE